MALKDLAVVGMTFKFVNSAHSGTVAVTGIPSTKVKADGVFVYKTGLAISITGGTDGAITAATGLGTMIGTAVGSLVDSAIPLRKGDLSVPITMTGTPPSSGAPTTYATVVEIDDPGQNKVSSE